MTKIERKWEFISNVLRKRYPVLSQLAKDIDGILIKYYGFNCHTNDWVYDYNELNEKRESLHTTDIFRIASLMAYCIACDCDRCKACLIYKKFGACSSIKILQTFFMTLEDL